MFMQPTSKLAEIDSRMKNRGLYIRSSSVGSKHTAHYIVHNTVFTFDHLVLCIDILSPNRATLFMNQRFLISRSHI